MILSLLGLIRKKSKGVNDLLKYPQGKRYYRDSHSIRKDRIDPDALKVIHRLTKFGYKAYLVGGSIRDILMGRNPKDFDVVTNATPNQIRNVFSNSRIIGRRFKLVHVNFRNKVVEVSTFRSLPETRLQPGKVAKNENIYVKRDNEYGSPKEDAARRDFTFNALFFDPRNEAIIDFVGGFDDLRQKQLRVIGDPDMSFREDPVRMIRAAKFATLLGMEMDRTITTAIKRHKNELKKVNSSRLLEEYNKIFRTRRTGEILNVFHELGMLEVLFPAATSAAKRNKSWGKNFLESGIGQRIQTADSLAKERDTVGPIIYHCLLVSELGSKYLSDHNEKNLLQTVTDTLGASLDPMEMPRSQKERIIRIYSNYNKLISEDPTSRRLNQLMKKDFFKEAVLVYKIISMTDHDEESLNRVFSLEVGYGLDAEPGKGGRGQQKDSGGKGRSGGSGRGGRGGRGKKNTGGRGGQNRGGNRSSSVKSPGRARNRSRSKSAS